MNDLENLKKKLLYRSNYRGTKEMDILLSTFVKFYINKLNRDELIELDSFLNLEDELIYKIISKWDDEFSNDPNWYKEDGDDVKDRLVMKCDEYFVSFVKEWIKNTCDDVDWWDFNSDTMILSIMNCASGDVREEDLPTSEDKELKHASDRYSKLPRYVKSLCSAENIRNYNNFIRIKIIIKIK